MTRRRNLVRDLGRYLGRYLPRLGMARFERSVATAAVPNISSRRITLFELTTLAVVSLTLGSLQAAENSVLGRSCLSTGQIRNCPLSAFCPDDYCRKPEPRVPCAAWGCNPECFVRKSLPCPPRTSGCVTCDDYVPQRFPAEPCPFRPYPLAADAYAKARWYEQPFSGRTAALSILRR